MSRFTKAKHYLLATALTFTLLVPVVTFAQDTQLPNPFGGRGAEPTTIITVVAQTMLGIVGAGTLLMFIWGGMNMIFAAGNEEKISQGKTILIWATIGLAIILTSYSVLQFTFNVLSRAASEAPAASSN